MKKIAVAFLLTLSAAGLHAQDIKLPAPQKSGGKPLMTVLNERHSSREFSGKELSSQNLSNLLWSAWGYNRENKRTAPSSRDKQEIDVYVFMKTGTYVYDARNNVLKQIDKKDLRKETGAQPFVQNASVNLVYVADTDKISGKDPQATTEAIYANTGFIAQNVYLYCASAGLNCVVRAMIPKEELAKTLKLKPGQVITLAQSVGYGE